MPENGGTADCANCKGKLVYIVPRNTEACWIHEDTHKQECTFLATPAGPKMAKAKGKSKAK